MCGIVGLYLKNSDDRDDTEVAARVLRPDPWSRGRVPPGLALDGTARPAGRPGLSEEVRVRGHMPAAVKQAEFDAYRAAVCGWEIDRYLIPAGPGRRGDNYQQKGGASCYSLRLSLSD
jgi:hypothetical protein